MTKKESELIDIYNQGYITKIFENQRITFNKDIIFLKEEILKEFKAIETNLNSKYDKQNVNTVNKLYKFESTIEAMKNKIRDLSTLISSDKNIQQKILQLTEFKRTIGDKFITQEIGLKLNSSELKEAINKYDKILSESVIYPGIIGNNGQFKDFHEMIDYILFGINQFNLFKDKNSVDFKDYTLKIDNLCKSLKAQSESIVSSCNNYCSKKKGELLTKFENIVRNIDDKIKELNNIIKNENEIKEEIYQYYEKEKKILNEYKKEIEKEFEKYKYEFTLINKRLKVINKKIKNEKNNNKEIIVENKEHNSKSNQNSRINLKKSQIGSSIIKKYIYGEVNYNKLENSFSKKELNKNSNKKLTEKRMTLGPDKLQDIVKNNDIKKNSDLIDVGSKIQI